MTTRKQAYKLFNRYLKPKATMFGTDTLSNLTYMLVMNKKIGWNTRWRIIDAAYRAGLVPAYDHFTEEIRVKVARELR